MNYLGHLVQSRNLSPGMRIGNVLGDFYKRLPEELHPEIKAGVLYHRKIDIYMDRHPQVRASMARIASPLRRFAGILVDMYYDHFLALEWEAWTGRDLPSSASEFYREILEWKAWWTKDLEEVYPWLVKYDWLSSYRETSHLARSFQGLAQRLRAPNNLQDGLEPLLADYEGFRTDFHAYMPDYLENCRPESASS